MPAKVLLLLLLAASTLGSGTPAWAEVPDDPAKVVPVEAGSPLPRLAPKDLPALPGAPADWLGGVVPALAIVSVHTPEFPAERVTASVAAAVERLAIPYPVLLDPDSHVRAAFENAYWPAVYLFDHLHARVDVAIGELHLGTSRGDRMEAQIRGAVERVLPTERQRSRQQ